MKKKTKIIMPSYVLGFECIGGACEDSCCIGWDIDIDKITYRQYFRTKDMQMKKEFIKHVYRNEGCDSEEVDYGRVQIKESKWCPFLNENKLCRIYSTLGEDYLSNVCYSYPRVYNILNNVYELSLYMSCPEAVRKMMTDDKPLRFLEAEVSLEKHIIHSFMDTREKQWINSPMGRLKELRTMSIEMIQNRRFSLQERLLRLGHKLEIVHFSSSSKTKPNNSDIKVHNNYIFQTGFFRDVIESLNVFSEIDSSVFVGLTEKVLSAFKFNCENSLIEQGTLYEKSIKTIVEPFLADNSYLPEHFLVNFMFQTNFPFTENQDVFDGYLMLIIRYAFIRFYLAGIAAVEGKLLKEDIILMIQVYTKTVDHHKTFILDLLQDLKLRNFDNMEFISILLS